MMGLDAKKRAELDQIAEAGGEITPLLAHSLYRGFCEKFTEPQAWELTKIAVFGMCGGKGISM